MNTEKKIERTWIVGFLCGFILSGLIFSQPLEEEHARLDGKILDIRKKPLAQAEIQLNHQATNRIFHSKSNKKGKFTFRMLLPGKYVLTVTKEGYKSFSMDVELQPGSWQEFEITLADELSSEEKNQQEAFSSFQKGIELAKENRTDEAIKAFRKATELKTDFAEAYINLGILLFQQAMDEEAERVLLRALELKPEEPKTKEMLGKINFAKAKALLQDDKIDEALEKLKASYSTSYLLGYAYYKKKNREKSIKYFEAFLQMEPNAPQASQVRAILESLKK
ncbi:MAG: carboxypeptidase regulatory-like domain-containing protein [Candidatus Zixiibacteriota bacterium]